MELKEATKQLNKTKEIFEHLKYHGWINDIKRDVDASDVIEAIDTVLAELDKQTEKYEQGYNEGYLYPHDFPNHEVEQQYLPDAMLGTKYYIPDETEEKLK